jgi:hypothetical protein
VVTSVVEKLVAAAEALPETPRRKMIAALLRRAQTEAHDHPRDQEWLAAADGILRELGRREQSR